MADPKQPQAQPSILDSLVNGAYNPLSTDDGGSSSTPAPGLLLSASSPSTTAPTAPKGPTLGTQDQLTAASDNADRGPATGGSWSDNGNTLTLPPQTKDNSSEPLSPEDHVGILKTIGRLAGGAVGLENPNSSKQANLGSKIGGLIGRAGAGLALAAGTPEQKQLAEEQLQAPMKMAQIANEMRYRNGLLANKGVESGIHQQRANTADQMADVAQQNADSNEGLRAAHQKQIEASLNGEVFVMPEIAHAIGRPELAGKNMSPIQYQQQVSNVLKSLGVKNQDLGEEGVWGTSPITGRITRLGDSPSVARANSMLLRTQIPVNDVQGNTLGWVNPQTNSYTPVSAINAKGGGAPLSTALGGDVIPPKPTSSVLSRGQVAQTILPMVPQIQGEVDALAGKIGPGEGRWNDFWVNKGGAKDKDFAGLDQDLQLYAPAIGLAHFGAGMPQNFVQDMMKDFGEAQDPENLKSRIAHAETWVQGYAARIGGGAGNPPAPKKGTTVPNSNTPNSNNNKPLTLNEANDYLRKAGGDPKSQATKDRARALAKKDGRSF